MIFFKIIWLDFCQLLHAKASELALQIPRENKITIGAEHNRRVDRQPVEPNCYYPYGFVPKIPNYEIGLMILNDLASEVKVIFVQLTEFLSHLNRLSDNYYR